MSERKVLTKYYPPDFDPRTLGRSRAPKHAGPKVVTVRLMAPFSMRCTTCGEYIYKGRKFNARKETPDEHYLGIQIFRFYIRCTRCSAEITFKTDPRNQDYACERGAKRNTEPWRVGREETDEERLDRLEKEEEERNAMVELEAKTVDAKREMAVADALDEIRTRNARLERAEHDGVELDVASPEDDEKARLEKEDAEAAHRAFEQAKRLQNQEGKEEAGEAVSDKAVALPVDTLPGPASEFTRHERHVKKKVAPAVGIKRKDSRSPEESARQQQQPANQATQKKAALVDYDDSDSE